MTPLVTVAVAARNETSMLVMTVLSALEAFKAAGIEGEVFVVDNSDPRYWEAVRVLLAGAVKGGNVRVVHEPRVSLALAIDRAHREAAGEYLLYVDAHSLLGARVIEPLLDAAIGHPERAFIYGPLQWAHMSAACRKTHFRLNRTRLGGWAPLATTVRKVPWKGMPYLIRRETYEAIGGLGCCAEHALGWGVLRYLGMKPWLLGYENWAVPEGTVYHFGEWPASVRDLVKYRTYGTSGEGPCGIAYAVTAYVMGGEEFLREEYEPAHLGRFSRSVEEAVAEAKRIGGREREWILAHQTISLQDLLANPPWPPDVPSRRGGPPLVPSQPTISDEYRRLNEELHRRPGTTYGEKGHQQAERVKAVAKRFHCASILDYGAGKQTLAKALRSMGCRDVRDYDPAVAAIAAPPARADLVACLDVLEHVEPERLAATLDHLRELTGKILFLRVCTAPCTSKALADGSSPHRLVRDRAWWIHELEGRFELLRWLDEPDERYFSLLARPRRSA